jgi:hypothetical protein
MAEMIRRFSWTLALLCCWGPASAEAQQNPAAGPVCVYGSKSYSDGAFICVQKSLMLNCASDGARATWKIVADKDLNERCVAPTALTYAPRLRQHSRRTIAIRHRNPPVAQGSAKCFSFNGKQYCE